MKKFFAVLLIAGLAISQGCNKDEDLDPFEILFGTWSLTEVEAESLVTGETSTANGAGTITFNEDGTGSLNYSYNILGTSSTTSGSFNYNADENSVRLNPGQTDELYFNRIVNENDRQVLEFDQDIGTDVLVVRLTFEK